MDDGPGLGPGVRQNESKAQFATSRRGRSTSDAWPDFFHARMAVRLHALAHPLHGGPALRILVTDRLYGSIDGIRIDRFQPGGIYEVGATIGSYLLAVGAGVPVGDHIPATAPAPERQLFGVVVTNGYGATRMPPDKDADRRRKKRKSTG